MFSMYNNTFKNQIEMKSDNTILTVIVSELAMFYNSEIKVKESHHPLIHEL